MRMRSKRTIQQIEYLLPRITETLENIYGETLVEVILYGSFARNTPPKIQIYHHIRTGG